MAASMAPSSSKLGLDAVFLDKVNSLKAQFFSALKGDAQEFKSFDASWAAFSETLQQQAVHLSADTLSLIYSFADTVDVVACNLLECHVSSEEVTQQMSGDVESLLGSASQLSVEDQSPSFPAYMESCCEWLFHNLHNPYPPSSTRIEIASRTKTLKQDIDAWFVDARKRIGWNSLRKNRFRNKKADIITAAKQFFIKDDPFHPLDPSIESAFAGIQGRAQQLYQRHFSESPLAATLDQAVRDLTPELKHRIQQTPTVPRISPTLAGGKQSYPTPESSPDSNSRLTLSPSPSLSELPSVNWSEPRRKRDRSASCEISEDDCSQEAFKRRRLDSHHEATSISCLPSPPFSTRAISSGPPDVEPPNEGPSALSPSPLKRKRCSSETATLPDPKRRATTSGSLRAVSDSAPAQATESLEDWYTQLFGPNPFPTQLPNAVGTDVLDPTLPLDVEAAPFPSSFNQPNHFSASSSFPPLPTATTTSSLDQVSDSSFISGESMPWFYSTSSNSCPNYNSISNAVTLPTSLPSLSSQANPTPHPSLDSFSWDLQFHGLDQFTWPLSSGSLIDAPFSLDCPSDNLYSSLSCSDPVKEAKLQELHDLERRLTAIRAEIAADS